jgi:uracil-DNA glycosylase
LFSARSFSIYPSELKVDKIVGGKHLYVNSQYHQFFNEYLEGFWNNTWKKQSLFLFYLSKNRGNVNIKLHPSWSARLKDEINSEYFRDIFIFLEKEKKLGHVVYPEEHLIFEALNRTSFEAVNVVILGQDPYHGKNQANGLAFSVSRAEKIPPSLKNIYKELQADLHLERPIHGSLESWADQGVLLLNSTLTVRAGEPRSHHNKGWEMFTDAVLQKLVDEKDSLIFMFWGKLAQEKQLKIKDIKRHHILTAAHPSPYSAINFLGCKHFSKANEILKKEHKKPIEWLIK